MTTNVNHLEKLAILQIDFDIWSGQVKLADPDIQLGIGGKLPPKALADLGRKYVIDKIHLRSFGRLKSRARRLCLSFGMSFMNGFAVPIERIDEISLELDQISKDMIDAKAEFMKGYDGWVDDWALENSEYSQAIYAGALSKARVESRIGFEYQVFQVTPINETESNKLNGMASGLADELLDEITEEANTFFHNNLKGKETCQVSSQKTLKRLYDKVDGLSFLDSRFLSVVELLAKTINGYPSSGKIVEGELYFRILSATLILSSKTKIQEYAAGVVDVDKMADGYMLSAPATEKEDVLIPTKQQDLISSDNSSAKPFDLSLPNDDELDQFLGSKVANGDSNFF